MQRNGIIHWPCAAIFMALISLLISCGGEKRDDHNFNHNEPPPDENPEDPNQHFQPGGLAIATDFSGAVGLLAMENEQESTLRLQGEKNEEGDVNSSLLKIKDEGKVESVIKTGDKESEENHDTQCHDCGCPECGHEVPPIKTIALSPDKKFYLHFEHRFPFANESNEIVQCNLFRVKGGTVKDLTEVGAGEQSLECLDAETHVEQNWSIARESVFQFDKHGNIYYPGWRDGENGQTLYRLDSEGNRKIVINNRINFRDYFVTKNGGVFYVGDTCGDGGSCDGGGFFRYVAPPDANGNTQLTNIADGFWDFRFEPIEGASGDLALFFGPDPLANSTDAYQQTMCLFEFNPNGGTELKDKVSPVITCGNDVYSWINLERQEDISQYGNSFYTQGQPSVTSTAWEDEFKRRCESEGEVFAGGGQINRIHQNSSGEIFVIGNIQKKKAGSVSCNLSLFGDYCTKDNMPIAASTEATCQAAGGTWTVDQTASCVGQVANTRDACLTAGGSWLHNQSQFFSNVQTDICHLPNATAQMPQYYQVDAAGDATYVHYTDQKNCLASSGAANDPWNMLEQYEGLAKVDREKKTLVPMANDTAEKTQRFWFISNESYFSAKKQGTYALKKFVENSDPITLVRNFEVYHLTKSPADDRLLINGLDFSTNEFVFGSMDQSSGVITPNAQVNGRVNNLLIFE